MRDISEREDNLPKWAQELISSLRQRIRAATDPLIKEISVLRPKVDLLKTKNEALTELLGCAASGNHKTAQEIIKIIRAYDLTLTPIGE